MSDIFPGPYRIADPAHPWRIVCANGTFITGLCIHCDNPDGIVELTEKQESDFLADLTRLLNNGWAVQQAWNSLTPEERVAVADAGFEKGVHVGCPMSAVEKYVLALLRGIGGDLSKPSPAQRFAALTPEQQEELLAVYRNTLEDVKRAKASRPVTDNSDGLDAKLTADKTIDGLARDLAAMSDSELMESIPPQPKVPSEEPERFDTSAQ